MNKYTLKNELMENVRNRMDADRYNHTLGVAYTAASLAMCYGKEQEFIDRAFIAGLLHDLAKCIPSEELLANCIRYGIEITDCERRNPFLLHGKLGAYYTANEFKINDEDIINAITWHTTGRPDMSCLEKIIFIADYIEPQRYKQKNLCEIREMAFSDIDKCVYQIARDTIEYITSNNKDLDEMTVKTAEYYKRYC